MTKKKNEWEEETDAFNERASKALRPIYDAIKEAVRKGECLETVLTESRFAELKGEKTIVYKTRKCRNCGEDVVVGGTMTIVNKAKDQMLRISDKEICLCRANGCNGSVYGLDDDESWLCEGDYLGDYPGQMEAIRNAVIDFFERCLEKGMK